ncbi:MAG: trypsin-like peptidase domain-containing protein [Planctomycetaceae bacterium]|nr:trypsin-like peptidase domain-containing protein [Planctomycetaceae bacterium]
MFCAGRALPLLGAVAIVVAACSPACAQGVEPSLGERLLSILETGSTAPQTPHPAVARIVVPEGDGFAYGSGTLVDVNDQMGLVVTNWHVVQGGRGQITVKFPDGFESPAQVLKTDRDWDLAALAIRRPNVAPVRLSSQAPQPGETLTIAGYGSGRYRSVSGPCTQYVAPGTAFPYEMVELKARARQGDSGGPILNSRGELAGVLFGEGGGTTSGSYCGRVHLFLSGMRNPAPFAPATQSVALTANHTPATNRTAPPAISPVVTIERPLTPPAAPIANAQQAPPAYTPPVSPEPAVVSIGTPPLTSTGWQTQRNATPAVNSYSASSPNDDLIAWQEWQDMLGKTQPDRIKTILAGIGVILLALHTHRWVNAGE